MSNAFISKSLAFLKALLCFVLLVSGCTTKIYSQNESDELYKVILGHFRDEKNTYVLKLQPQMSLKGGQSLEKYLDRDSYLNNPYMDVPIDSIFTADDFKYMESQLSKLKNAKKFDIEKLKEYKIPFIQESDKPSEYMRVYNLSYALFSKDGNTALLYSESAVGMSGSGSVVIMKKKNGEWNYLSHVPVWVR